MRVALLIRRWFLMLFLPRPLSQTTLPEAYLRQDIQSMKKVMRCGIGNTALYLSSYFFDCRYYIPYSSISRVFKRVALSKGGFTGKGAFGALAYLVVVYDGSKEKQVNFKREEDVDLFIANLQEYDLNIKYMSAATEEQIRKERAKEARKPKVVLNEKQKALLSELEECEEYLKKEPVKAAELSAAAKKKRADDRSNPFYKWLALAIVLLGVVAAVWGIISLILGTSSFSIYFTIFGLALIFLFSGLSVMPTGRNNSAYIRKRYLKALAAQEEYAKGYGAALPLPAKYAHPASLTMMINIVKQGRAESADEAFELLKADLKAANADVEVTQEQFDLIMAVKPVFLLEEYS